MKLHRLFYIFLSLLVCIGIYFFITKINFNTSKSIGEIVDEFNQVKVYFNGGINHSSGRNLTKDGYNLGIKYQCVEFVKRYYFERFGHKMPDSYGNAKDFINLSLGDGALNPKRGLLQFLNNSLVKPHPEDLLVLGPSFFNPYGHVAIITHIEDNSIEIIQQNPGPFSHSREKFKLTNSLGHWTIENSRVLGWLRIPERGSE